MCSVKADFEWVKKLTVKPCLLWFWFGLSIVTLIRLWVAAASPLSPDEAYYWLWSNHLDYSFYDHPPMVALWIKLGCWIGNKTALGVRFLAPFAGLIGSVFIYFSVLDFCHTSHDKEKNAITAVVILNTTLAISVGSVTITPDTPLIFFICIFIWGCGRLIATQKLGWWLVIGIAAGCALLSKYTALLMIAGLGVWCILTVLGRFSLKSWKLWGGLFLTILIFLPVIIWNSRHQWISFLKQGGRTADWHPSRAVQFLSELMIGQIGLATPILFICFCWAMIKLTKIVWQSKAENDFLLWLWVIIPVCVFVQHAFGDRVQANWVGILYPVLSVITAIYFHRFIKSACILGNIMVGLIYIQSVFAYFPIPAKYDLMLKRLGGWAELAKVVSCQIPDSVPIIVDEYGIAAELAFYEVHHPIILVDRRWKYFALADYHGKNGYLIRTQRRKDMPPSVYFLNSEKKGIVVRKIKQRIAETYNIYKVELNYSNANQHEIVYLP